MKHKSYKFRLYPNKTQEVLFYKSFGSARLYWNYLTEVFNSYDKEDNPKPKYGTSTEFRKRYSFLKETSASILQQKERDFKEFSKQFFSQDRKTKLNRPQFKSKREKQSYRLPNQKFKINEGTITLEKIGNVKIIMHRSIPKESKFISVTISVNKSGQFFASVLVEQKMKQLIKTGKEVGIDVGIKTFMVQSDGIEIENLKLFSKNQAKLKRLQQHHSRKKNGSKRRDKNRIKIAKLYQKITNQRKWFLHNQSLRLVKEYDFIFIEDLDIKAMLESKLMSKNIIDVSWSLFFQMLQYKAKWYGKTVYKVDRYYASSKTCECGVKNLNLKLSDREWVCGSCGIINQRDLLASQNILKEGRRNLDDITNVEREVTNSVKR